MEMGLTIFPVSGIIRSAWRIRISCGNQPRHLAESGLKEIRHDYCDVQVAAGDRPSIEQLRSIVAEADRIDAAKAEIAELEEAIKSRATHLTRLTVRVYHGGPFPYYQIVATADTREELMAQAVEA